MSEKIKYIAFKDKKGNVVSVAQESIVRDQSSEVSLTVSEPPNTTKEIIDENTYIIHRDKLI